jgi:imidazolonepropionase-like amidohydrolase
MLTLSNARVFDGTQMLPGRRSVTLDGDRIVSVSEQPGVGAGERIDVNGMTLMPGLVTCHLHPDFFKFEAPAAVGGDQLGKELPPGVLMAIGVRTCRVLLESGFTGYVGAACSYNIDPQLKIAIREGIIPGPRILACSHHVGTTADANDPLKWWQKFQAGGIDVFADGPDDMRKIVREEIRCGAEVIKFFASPGHLIPHHRGHRNMSHVEMAALVETAHDRGALVRAHVCHKDVILECIELGVDIIDHADEIDEEVIEAMVKAGSYWVPSLTFTRQLLDLGIDTRGENTRSWEQVQRMLPVAQKAGVRIVLGDDYAGVFRNMVKDDPLDHQVGCYGREVAFYSAVEGISTNDVLGWGTRVGGQLLGRGEKVGVVEQGALADLIVVDGDPLADPGLFGRPNDTLKAVIRAGELTIDRLSPAQRQKAA